MSPLQTLLKRASAIEEELAQVSAPWDHPGVTMATRAPRVPTASQGPPSPHGHPQTQSLMALHEYP